MLFPSLFVLHDVDLVLLLLLSLPILERERKVRNEAKTANNRVLESVKGVTGLIVCQITL